MVPDGAAGAINEPPGTREALRLTRSSWELGFATEERRVTILKRERFIEPPRVESDFTALRRSAHMGVILLPLPRQSAKSPLHCRCSFHAP